MSRAGLSQRSEPWRFRILRPRPESCEYGADAMRDSAALYVTLQQPCRDKQGRNWRPSLHNEDSRLGGNRRDEVFGFHGARHMRTANGSHARRPAMESSPCRKAHFERAETGTNHGTLEAVATEERHEWDLARWYI